MARSDERSQHGKKRAAEGDPDGAQPLTKRFNQLQLGMFSLSRWGCDCGYDCVAIKSSIDISLIPQTMFRRAPVLGPDTTRLQLQLQ